MTTEPSPALSSFLRTTFRDKQIKYIVEDHIRSNSSHRNRRYGDVHPERRLIRSSKSCNALGNKATARWGSTSAKSMQNDTFTCDKGLHLPSRRSSVNEIVVSLPMLAELERTCAE